MKRKDIFNDLKNIVDPTRDYLKILGNLHYTHFALLDKYKRILKPYGLSFPQSHVLSIIVHMHPKQLSLEEIKEMVLEPNSDVSRTVVRLEEKGFLKKVKDSENRRKRAIMATSVGINVFRQLEKDKRFSAIVVDVSLGHARIFAQTLELLRDSK